LAKTASLSAMAAWNLSGLGPLT